MEVNEVVKQITADTAASPPVPVEQKVAKLEETEKQPPKRKRSAATSKRAPRQKKVKIDVVKEQTFEPVGQTVQTDTTLKTGNSRVLDGVYTAASLVLGFAALTALKYIAQHKANGINVDTYASLIQNLMK
jgi:hypothetical protein